MSDDKGRKLGEALIQAGILSKEQFREALEFSSRENSPGLIIALLELGYLTFKVFEKFLSSTQNIKSAIISTHDFNLDLINKVGVELITSRFVLPISSRLESSNLLLAIGMVDPTDSKTIKQIEDSVHCKVVPILISLPDFKAALEKNKNRIPALSQISLKDDDSAFEIQIEPTAQPSDESISRKGIRQRKSFSEKIEVLPDRHPGTVPQIKFTENEILGDSTRKFREEVLARLDLDPVEAKLLFEETYSRDLLSVHLRPLNKIKLQKIYNSSSEATKVEGLTNTLIAKGVISKYDILLSTAVSVAFKEDKK